MGSGRDSTPSHVPVILEHLDKVLDTIVGQINIGGIESLEQAGGWGSVMSREGWYYVARGHGAALTFIQVQRDLVGWIRFYKWIGRHEV